MVIYPYNSPIILNDAIFSMYGGLGTGSFPSQVLQSSYFVAERQVTEYIGTFLLPTTITGTYPFMHQNRIVTDYGYVQQLLNVSILTRQNVQWLGLQKPSRPKTRSFKSKNEKT